MGYIVLRRRGKIRIGEFPEGISGLKGEGGKLTVCWE